MHRTKAHSFPSDFSKVFYLTSLLRGKVLAMPYTKLEGSLMVIFKHPDYSGNASGCPTCWFSTWETTLWLSTRWISVDGCCRSRAFNTWSNTLGGLEECSYVPHLMLNSDLITDFHHVNADRPSGSPGGSNWWGVLFRSFPSPPHFCVLSVFPVCLFPGWVGLLSRSLQSYIYIPASHPWTIIFICLLIQWMGPLFQPRQFVVYPSVVTAHSNT